MTCPVCGHDMAAALDRCPRCGSPLPKEPTGGQPSAPQPRATQSGPAAPAWSPEGGDWSAAQPTAPIPQQPAYGAPAAGAGQDPYHQQPTAPIPPAEYGYQPTAPIPQPEYGYQAPPQRAHEDQSGYAPQATAGAYGYQQATAEQPAGWPPADATWAGAQQPPAGGYPPAPEAATSAGGKKSRRTIIAIVAAAVILVAGASVAGAAWFFGWFGGKTPADVIPGNAIAYVRVDINPSMAQKAAALQFFRGMPHLGEAGGDTDPRKVLWEWAQDQDTSGQMADIDYDNDIQPWLGDKVGLAAIPATDGSEPIAVVAIQVTDADKANKGLSDLLSKGSLSRVVTIKDGYAIITTAEQTDTVMDALADGTLSQNKDFTDSMASLGDPGLASGWVDLARAGSLIPSYASSTPAAAELKGTMAGAVRISADTLEIVNVTAGQDPELTNFNPQGQSLGDLPASTGAGMSIRGGGEWLTNNWDELLKLYGIDDWDSQAAYYLPEGITMPDDLAAILGQSLNVGITTDAISDLASGNVGQDIAVGAVSTGDDASRAQEVVQQLIEASGASGSVPLVDSLDGNAYSVALDSGYLDELKGEGDRLSSVPAFTKAVADPGRAATALYVDLEPMRSRLAPAVPSEYQDFVDSLLSVGYSATSGDGKGTGILRLVRS